MRLRWQSIDQARLLMHHVAAASTAQAHELRGSQIYSVRAWPRLHAVAQCLQDPVFYPPLFWGDCRHLWWCRREGDASRLSLQLPQNESADYLNFVVKDSATNRWYDSHGGNIRVPLRLALSSMAEVTIDEEACPPRLYVPG